MKPLEKKFRDKERQGADVFLVIPAAMFFVGAVTGTVVFARSYSGADASAFVEVQRNLPVSFMEYFVSYMLGEVPYFAALLLFSLTAVGWLMSPAALFVSGLRLGTSVCCLFSVFGTLSFVYAFPVVIVPALLLLVSRIILCRYSMLLSMQLFRSVFCPAVKDGIVWKFIVRIPLCAALELLAAALASMTRTVFYSFIS